MFIVDFFRNSLNALVGRNQEFEKLLAAKDISAVKEKMSQRTQLIMDALREYEVSTHKVMHREDKVITDKKGKILRREPVWKLPIPYPTYINEIALVFLYGQPVKWLQQSDGTDRAFDKFQEVIKRTRFDSKIRQCKRLAGAETESAMLWRVFKDAEGNPDVQIRVLARSKGDEIYTRFDQFENLLSFGWGYYVKEEEEKVVYHFDIFTPTIIYHCAKRSLGWEVQEEVNFVGKIPVILFQQDKEWKGVEPLIEREEMIASRTADTNDYFADPIAIMAAELIKNMPEKKEAAKLLITNDKEGVDKAARYLTWDSAPQSKKDEVEWLQTQILRNTFTPNITLDTLKSISQLSAKALRTVMMLADIKASKHKEMHDELLDRTASLIAAIIGNVLDVSLHDECEKMVVAHEFSEPFGEDVKEDIDNILRCVDGEILSSESAVEMNPLVRNITIEKQRLADEKEERQLTQQSIFGDIEGAGSQSATDGDDEENDEDSSETKPIDPKTKKAGNNRDK